MVNFCVLLRGCKQRGTLFCTNLIQCFKIVTGRLLVQKAILYLEILFVIVKFKLELLELLQLGHKALLLHFGEKSLHLTVETIEGLIDSDQISEPFRYLTLSRLVRVAMVHQNDRAVVLHVSNYAADGLIDSSCRLL